MNLELMSNAELKIYLKETEFEYEATQTRIKQDIAKMKMLDEKYLKIKEILNKRIKGKI